VTDTIDHETIAAQLARIELVHGVGRDKEHACTIAALNIALHGKLTDTRDACMSRVVHLWVIRVQDKMPVAMMQPGDEHGDRWRAAAPYIAGSATTTEREKERVQLILDWMWNCLSHNFEKWVPKAAHDAWRTMLKDRNATSARAARTAVRAYADDAAYAAAGDAAAGDAAAYAGDAAAYAAADDAADAAGAYAYAYAYAWSKSLDEVWRAADPARLLSELVK
jgi:hypothetical protein